MWVGSNSIYKNPLWPRCKGSGSLLLGAQTGTGYNAAQLGVSDVRRFADSFSPALARCDVCVDLGLVSLLLMLSFAPMPSGGRTPLWCSSILHPLQWGCTVFYSFTRPKLKVQLKIREKQDSCYLLWHIKLSVTASENKTLVLTENCNI